MRFLFYSHDGFGLGHTRRNLAIAAALTELDQDASILLATGTDDVNRLGVPPHVEVLKLPGLSKVANDDYAARRLPISTSDIRKLRSALLTAAVQSFRPNVMLVDKHPLGASGELRSALEELRAADGRAALGLRDVLDDRVTILCEWGRHNLQTRIADYHDRVLVYGQQAIFDPITEYDFPASVAEQTLFCGYVVTRPGRKEDDDDQPSLFPIGPRTRPVVLATTGGGEDGFTLLETFIRAASEAPWDGIVVAGPLAPESRRRTLRRLAAEAGIAFHTFVPGLDGQFGLADALVCKGGYNTLVEAVASGIPTVCVPRISPRREQFIRTQAFARLGLVRMVEPEQLEVDRLRMEVDAALQSSRQKIIERASTVLHFDGAQRSAAHLLELAETPRRTAVVQVAATRWQK